MWARKLSFQYNHTVIKTAQDPPKTCTLVLARFLSHLHLEAKPQVKQEPRSTRMQHLTDGHANISWLSAQGFPALAFGTLE